MRLVELDENRLLFVLNNKDLKSIKRTVVPLNHTVANKDRHVVFSFITEEHYPKQAHELALRRQTEVTNNAKRQENEDGKKAD